MILYVAYKIRKVTAVKSLVMCQVYSYGCNGVASNIRKVTAISLSWSVKSLSIVLM